MNPDIMDRPDHPVTAKDFMDNIYLSVAWDEMHGCVEAAPSDCPHQEVLQRIFSPSLSREKLDGQLANDDKLSAFVESAFSSDSSLSLRNDEERDAEHLANLCRLALRVHTAAKKLPNDAPHNKWQHRCHQPLVDGIGATTPPSKMILPNMQVPLPEHEASQWIAQSALQVRDVEVMSVLGIAPDEEGLKLCMGSPVQSSPSSSRLTEESKANEIQDCLSSLVEPTQPAFYCAIFHSSSNSDFHNPSNSKQFYRLHRYSHLSTTSLVRQLDAFGIDMPVIGVLLSGSRVAFHVDWSTTIDGRVEIDSALYTPDEVEEDFKQWDLSQPADALEVVLILDNLKSYASGAFKDAVTSGLSNFRARIYSGEFKAWRWDGKMMLEGGDGRDEDYEESQSISSIATDEEMKVESPVDAGVDVHIQDTETEGDQMASVALLTAALTLQQKTDAGRRMLKRILPSPPRTPAEDLGSQTPTTESQ